MTVVKNFAPPPTFFKNTVRLHRLCCAQFHFQLIDCNFECDTATFVLSRTMVNSGDNEINQEQLFHDLEQKYLELKRIYDIVEEQRDKAYGMFVIMHVFLVLFFPFLFLISFSPFDCLR